MIFKSPLMGASFRFADEQATTLSLKHGNVLHLERDADNPFDQNAIKVIRKQIELGDIVEYFLGFIAKEVAVDLAPLMDADDAQWQAIVMGGAGTKKPQLEIMLSDDEVS